MERPLLSRKEAANYLRKKGIQISHQTLGTYIWRGGGPPFSRFGEKGAPTYYRPDDLDEWVLKRLRPVL